MATRSLPVLSLEAAQIASAAAQEKAKSMGIDCNIALVDSTLQLLHFARMGNAKLTSIDITINKAFTAAGHRAATATYSGNKDFLPGGVAYSIQNSNGGRFTFLSGGVPIEIEGNVVGAIGIGGGSPAQDIEVAETGVQAILDFVKRSKGGAL